MGCKRCGDCANNTHHWLDNGDFGNDPNESEGPTGNSHICKHCDVVGHECPDCDGRGEIEDEYAVGQICPTCDSEGVIVAPRRTYEEFLATLEGGGA